MTSEITIQIRSNSESNESMTTYKSEVALGPEDIQVDDLENNTFSEDPGPESFSQNGDINALSNEETEPAPPSLNTEENWDNTQTIEAPPPS